MEFLLSKVMEHASTDLHLGLSIGGSSWEAESAGQSQGSLRSVMGSGWASADLDVEDPTHFSGHLALVPDGRDESELQHKRALQARRRLEAVRKQAEKRKKRGFCPRGTHVPSGTKEEAAPEALEPPPMNSSSYEASENEGLWAEPPTSDHLNTEPPTVLETAPNTHPNATSLPDPTPQGNPNLSLTQSPDSRVQAEAYGVPAVPVVPVPYPYAMPVVNGFSYPYWMPVWPAVPVPAANPPNNVEGTVFHPLPMRTLPPASMAAGSPANNNIIHGESGPVRDTETGVAFKQVPPSGRSSSDIPEYQTGSFPEGSRSSERKTGLGHHAREKLPVRLPGRARIPCATSENSISSHQMASPSRVVDRGANCEKVFQTEQPTGMPNLMAFKSAERKLEGATFMNKTIIREENAKPQGSPVRSRLLSVSTTGNGPKGKTVTGFLYKYTRSNISIVCNCHGIPLSPADFVLHAGGTSIANPTKKIYMVPPS